MTITQIKNLSYRPQDLIYDPLFVVSGPRDHYKAALLAKMSMAKYQVCPVFSNMFSDSPNYPRKQLVLRRQRNMPTYREQKAKSDKYFKQLYSKPNPIQGGTRPKFFSFPVITYPSDVIPFTQFPAFTLKKLPRFTEAKERALKAGKMNEIVQTDYRDSEMQTSPWQPDYKIMSNDGSVSPQILKLDFLKWGSGLPAGKHEVMLIERARMKRAWEKYLPPPIAESSLEQRRNIIEAMERDEWVFREQEINEIKELRMKLLEEMLAELHQKSNDRNKAKLKNVAEMKKNEIDDKIQKLRKKTERELRKLEMKHRGVKTKYQAVDVVEEHAQPKSELYAPLMRHGEHPMRWHQIMTDKLKYYKAQFIGVEHFSTLPRWLNTANVMKDDYNTVKLPGTKICMRETKWTTPVLKKLHEELKNLHKTVKRKCTLRVKIEKTISEADTPEVTSIPDESEEEAYQALVAVQSVLKGRASQMLIYEGRDKCRELIRELKFSTSVLEEQKETIAVARKKIKHQQREEAIQANKIAKLQKSLNKLEGSIVGSLLDFLNKELRRLLDERRAHAICFLNERERNDREAAEAGRRQQEIRRRREHDEMFKQVVKVHQDTVDLYMEDIITEGMEFASNEEAKFYLEKLKEKIDADNAEELEHSIEITEQEEMIADLVHHFVLPEVQKQMVRDRIKNQQIRKLRTVNNTVMDDLLEMIPSPKTDRLGDIGMTEDEELPPTGFQFQYETEKELIESMWKGEEYPTLPATTPTESSSERTEEIPEDILTTPPTPLQFDWGTDSSIKEEKEDRIDTDIVELGEPFSEEETDASISEIMEDNEVVNEDVSDSSKEAKILTHPSEERLIEEIYGDDIADKKIQEEIYEIETAKEKEDEAKEEQDELKEIHKDIADEESKHDELEEERPDRVEDETRDQQSKPEESGEYKETADVENKQEELKDEVHDTVEDETKDKQSEHEEIGEEYKDTADLQSKQEEPKDEKQVTVEDETRDQQSKQEDIGEEHKETADEESKQEELKDEKQDTVEDETEGKQSEPEEEHKDITDIESKQKEVTDAVEDETQGEQSKPEEIGEHTEINEKQSEI